MAFNCQIPWKQFKPFQYIRKYIQCMRWKILTFFPETPGERITSEARSTATDRVVIHNLTPSIKTTSTRTRVHTLLIDTCFILRAFCAYNTFRFATWRCSYIISLTRANCMTIHHTALAEWSAWRRLAWVLCRWLCWCYKKMKWQRRSCARLILNKKTGKRRSR
jgi:hypothetical protein